MEAESFFQVIHQLTPLSADSKQALAAILKRIEFPKGHVLIGSGTVCHAIYFIEKGLTRTFYYKDGKDITDWLSAENSFAGSMVSFLTRQPDSRAVELLEPSILWAIPYEGLEKLYASSHEIERLGRLLTNHGFVLLQQRFDDLHFATALERYQKLITNYPTFIQRVPLGMIASYIGVSQETLSRIRAQV